MTDNFRVSIDARYSSNIDLTNPIFTTDAWPAYITIPAGGDMRKYTFAAGANVVSSNLSPITFIAVVNTAAVGDLNFQYLDLSGSTNNIRIAAGGIVMVNRPAAGQPFTFTPVTVAPIIAHVLMCG